MMTKLFPNEQLFNKECKVFLVPLLLVLLVAGGGKLSATQLCPATCPHVTEELLALRHYAHTLLWPLFQGN